MTIRLASDGPQTVRADTIGAAWLAVAGRILAEGIESRYDGLAVREISLVTVVVEHPGPDDVWLPDGVVELIAYAHSIDFGAKGYANLVELAALQQHVAGQLGRPAGRLLMMVKSAHVYETERGYLRGVLEEYR